MGTASINGLTYPTTVVGGREWLSVDYLGPGRMSHPNEYPNGTLYPILAHYRFADIMAQSLPEGWRVPTPDDWQGLLDAAGGTGLGGKLKAVGVIPGFSSDVPPFQFLPPNIAGEGAFGVNIGPSGCYDGSSFEPYGLYNYGMYWANDNGVPCLAYFQFDTAGCMLYTGETGEWELAVRLVRDALLPIEDPILSVASGYSAGPITVAVTCATPTAVLHYTTDGSTPTESSPVLNGGICLGSWISPTITLKVIATALGYSVSSVVSATYQFTAQAPMASLQMQPESGYSFSAAESRKPRAFGACGKGIFKGTLQWELLDSEWPMYLEWWEAKQKGVQPFDIYCCTGDHATLHTFQAVGTPSILRETGLRKVSIPVKLTNRPTGLVVGWGHALVGPPVAYPPLVPMPQWGYRREEASLYLSTSGAPTVARPVATRGELLSLEWKALSGFQFDMLVDWWATYLGQGRRKFYLSLPDRGDTLLCQLVEDPSFTVEGVHFQGSMQVFAAAIHTLAPLPT